PDRTRRKPTNLADETWPRLIASLCVTSSGASRAPSRPPRAAQRLAFARRRRPPSRAPRGHGASKSESPVNLLDSRGKVSCEGEDSNLHGSYPASTSSWCVCHSATFAGWTSWSPPGRRWRGEGRLVRRHVKGRPALGWRNESAKGSGASLSRALRQQRPERVEELPHFEGLPDPRGEATGGFLGHPVGVAADEKEGSAGRVAPDVVEPGGQAFLDRREIEQRRVDDGTPGQHLPQDVRARREQDFGALRFEAELEQGGDRRVVLHDQDPRADQSPARAFAPLGSESRGACSRPHELEAGAALARHETQVTSALASETSRVGETDARPPAPRAHEIGEQRRALLLGNPRAFVAHGE